MKKNKSIKFLLIGLVIIIILVIILIAEIAIKGV